MIDLKTAMAEAGFDTFAALARAVLRLWNDRDPKTDKPAEASIATKLGDLIERHRSMWWANQDDATAALADALVVDIEDLSLKQAKPNDFLFEFPDVPGLRPLDLLVEEPCKELSPALWSEDLVGADSRGWFHMLPGAGRTLLARWHRRRAKLRVIEVRHLSEAAMLAGKGKPVLISVDEPDPATDKTVTDELFARRGFIICAPFPAPIGAKARATFKQSASPGAGFYDPSSEDPPQEEDDDESLRAAFWRPAPSMVQAWPEHFTKWILRRTDGGTDPRFVERIIAGLQILDPGGELIQTPGDLLPFLGVAIGARGGLKGFDAETFAEKWFPVRFQRTPGEGSGLTWLRAAGHAALRALILSSLEGEARTWPPALTRDEAASLIVEDAVPEGVMAPLVDEVRRVAATENARERKRAAKHLETQLGPTSRRVAIGHLIDAGLLRLRTDGRYEIVPRWLPLLIARNRVRQALSGVSSHIWGAWAADPSRTILVDQAIRAVPDAEFGRLIERSVAEFNPTEYGSAGAVEALFSHVAERIRDSSERVLPDLQGLWSAQRSLLAPFFFRSPPGPVTRSFSGYGHSPPFYRWLADAWTWSLRVNPPPDLPEASLAWVFPGWLNHSLRDVHYMIDYKTGRGGASPALDLLLPEVLAGCTDTELPPERHHLPFPLDVLRVAIERDWELPAWYCDQVWFRMRSRASLEKVLAELPVDKVRSALTRLVKQFMKGGIVRGMDRALSRDRVPGLRDLVLEFVDREEVVAAGAAWGRSLSHQYTAPPERALWPLDLWVLYVESGIDAADKDPRKTLTERLGERHWASVPPSVVVKLLPFFDPSWQGVHAMWDSAPDVALEIARQLWPNGENAYEWVLYGRTFRFTEILELIEKSEVPLTARDHLHSLMLLKADAAPVYWPRIYAQLHRFRTATPA